MTRELQLLGPEGDLISYNVERVRARIDVQEVLTTREFRRIRITVKNTEYRVVPAPPLADVVVRGPQRVVDKMSLANGEVFVDASGQGPGTVTLPVSVLLPPEVEIVAQDPNEVELNLLSESEKKSPSAPPPEKKKKSGV